MTEQEYQAELYELRQQQQAADDDVRRAYWAYKANPTSPTLAAAPGQCVPSAKRPS